MHLIADRLFATRKIGKFVNLELVQSVAQLILPVTLVETVAAKLLSMRMQQRKYLKTTSKKFTILTT